MCSRSFLKCGLAFCLAATTSWAAADLRLMEAVRNRDPKTFAALLAKGVDVNAAAPDGATALSWSVYLGQPDMADKLIRAGAKVNTTSEYGETPLTLALSNGDAKLAEKLITAGANPNVTRWNGETSLMIAAGVGSVDCVRLLLAKGVDVNGAEPKSLQNALMWAASEGHSDVVDVLIEKGATVNTASKTGFTALVFAVQKDHVPTVQRLLKAGASANFALPDQTKILAFATANRAYNSAITLLDGGADPASPDRTGITPLHAAAQAGSLDLVKKLLSKGAPVDVKTLPAAGGGGFRAPSGAQTPLLMAARANRVEVMKVLIAAGADVKAKSQDGSGLLLTAAASGRVASAKYAFEFDKDVNAVDEAGQTAMHKCVSGGGTQDEMTELAQYLADIGVPLDQKDKRGRTPIQAGDGIPYDKPIQRMADIIVSRGGTPFYFPKEYIKPGQAR